MMLLMMTERIMTATSREMQTRTARRMERTPIISKTDIAAAMPIIIVSLIEAQEKAASQAGAVKKPFCFDE